MRRAPAPSPASCRRCPTRRARSIGNNLVCRVTDTGAGVPEDVLPHIFEPFFTTKANAHGMGLALTYQFIRLHHGEVRADMTPGPGLTVTITLPIISPLDDAAADAVSATRDDMQPDSSISPAENG